MTTHGPGRVPGVRRLTDAIDRLDARDGAQETRTGREGSGMGVEADEPSEDVVRALATAIYPAAMSRSRWEGTAIELAYDILADPGPLLAALAEAGVLRRLARETEFGRHRDTYGYRTEWRPADD